MNASETAVTAPRSLRNKARAMMMPLAVSLFTLCSSSAFACAACFGKSDSAMAKSVNAGIFSLMAVIVTVLIGAASFFVFLARKASSTPEPSQPADSRKA